MDLLSRQVAYEQIHAKLVRSYAMDALLEHSRGTTKAAVQTPENFLKEAGKSKESRFESPGFGYDYRLEGTSTVGSALVFEGAIIHLAFFSLEKDEQERPMSGYRRRRGFRRLHSFDGPIE